MQNINVYAFSGKIGVGKDFLARRFIDINNITKYSYICFADPFKLDVIVRDNIPYEDVFVKKTTESRTMLQKRGTEEGRNKYGKDIWINYVQARIRIDIERGITNFIITDARFKNELSWLRSINAHIYRIHAPQRNWNKLLSEGGSDENANLLSRHSSEIDLDDEHFDTIIDNDYRSNMNVTDKKLLIY